MAANADLSAEDRDLIDAASELIGRQGRDPHHTVAAAARDARGGVHRGLNLYHFTGAPCAELVALANAAAATDVPVVAMVAVGDRERGVVSPCGRCRQVMLDYFPEMVVLVPGPGGVERVPVQHLLAYAFVRSDQEARP